MGVVPLRAPRLGAALAFVLALAGCASPRVPALPEGSGAQAWTGRFAATWTIVGEPPREERANGRFQVRALGDTAEMEIVSPFGQTLARASARPGHATLETADGRAHQAASPQALTETVLGWRVPIERLPRWLSGEFAQPGPATADREDEVRVVDEGWQVAAGRWTAGRPLRLTLRWPADPAADDTRRVEIRLAVDADTEAGAR